MSIDNQITSTYVTPIVVGHTKSSSSSREFNATEAQLEVWLSSQQSVEANCSYNEISSIWFTGDLNIDAITNSIDRVVQRHESLRTTFSSDGSKAIVHAELNYQYEFLDLTSISEEELEIELLKVVQEQARVPFDLIDGPLLRIVLQKTTEQTHKLTFAAHHIVMDGWSLAIFCRDLGKFYDANVKGTTPELPEVNQYCHYADLMQNYFASEQGRQDEEFWLAEYADSVPVLDLPIVGKRPKLRTYSGQRYEHTLPADLVDKLRKQGAKSGCSLFNTMLAAFTAYVSRLSGSEEICLAIPTAGQAAMDQPELIGHCVNAMPFRTTVAPQSSLSKHLTSTRSRLLDAFDHQRYSFGSLLRKLAPPRDPSRPPMLAISFNIDPVLDASEMGFEGLTVATQIEPRVFENFEWFINGIINEDQSIEMQVQYNSDLFTEESMAFYFEGFEAFLHSYVEHPESAIEDLPMMSVAQRQRVIVDWNATQLNYPQDASLHSEFSRQALETPEQIAVEFNGEQLTYRQVDQRSNQVARYLQAEGIQPGDLVGICVPRSQNMLVYLYGILKSGAGYVPLDPAYPTDRLQYMCEHSQLKTIVTESQLVDRIKQFEKPLVAIDQVSIESVENSNPFIQTTPNDTCYVIYTSGSTGKPKGVQVPHGPVVNFLHSMKQTPGFCENDRILAVTTLSFDIAVLELYLPTIFGGTVVIADQDTTTDGVQLAESIDSNNISLMQATPATWRLLINSNWTGKSDLKVLCGGEPMPTDLVGPLLQRCNELWNMYGPTETTVWSSAFQITDPADPILIGKPIGNTQIYILDKNGSEVPVGVEGEVFIGGAGVTHGYLHRQDLTDERFIDHAYFNPFENYANHRVYKTGDLAKYRFTGDIEFLRRNDKQVKVRGFRIELGEIEKHLEAHSAIQQTVVIVREDNSGDARLVAYWIGEVETPVNESEFRNHLRESVPYYMIPQHFVRLESMPQTNNGKIDYKALPAPESEEHRNDLDIVEPKTDAEKLLASVWKQVLDTDEVSLHDNFFDIGGHSLLVMQVIVSIEKATGTRLGPQEFLMGTLEQLASKISPSESQVSQAATLPDDTRASEGEDDNPGGLLKKLKGFWD